MAAGSAGEGAGSNTELRWPHVTATAGSTRRQPPEADFGAPSSDDVDELGRSRGSQMTSHTSIIGHGRRKRGGGRWEQHRAPLATCHGYRRLDPTIRQESGPSDISRLSAVRSGLGM